MGFSMIEDRYIAKLEWERRYLLNRLKDVNGVIGNYGKSDTFSDTLMTWQDAQNKERELRNKYSDLGGDIKNWWFAEAKSWFAPYGYIFDIKEKEADIYKLSTEGNKLIATMDWGCINYNRFYLCCRTDDTIDSKQLSFDENWGIVRQYVFQWDKNE